MATAKEEIVQDPKEAAKPEEETPKTDEAKPEEKVEPKVYTEEEVEAMRKKMQSDSDRGVQKILAEKKVADSVIDAVKQISANPSALVHIAEKNPVVAEKILSTYYEGQTLEQYKEAIQYKEDLSDPEVFKSRLERETRKISDDLVIKQEKEAFIAKLKMDGDERKEFEKAFEERRGMRSFSVENLQAHLERAYREIDKTDINSLRSKEAIGKTMATSEAKGGNSSGKESSLDKARAEAKAFLNKYSA